MVNQALKNHFIKCFTKSYEDNRKDISIICYHRHAAKNLLGGNQTQNCLGLEIKMKSVPVYTKEVFVEAKYNYAMSCIHIEDTNLDKIKKAGFSQCICFGPKYLGNCLNPPLHLRSSF